MNEKLKPYTGTAPQAESEEIRDCETCADYMVESKNCKHNTDNGCDNWHSLTK